MIKLLNVKKKIHLLIYFSLFLALLFFLIYKNFFNLKEKLYLNYPNLKIVKYILKKDNINFNLGNDYNVKFIPFTQFEKIKFFKKKLNFQSDKFVNKTDDKIAYKNYHSFFIDLYKNSLIITDYLGDIYHLDDLENQINLDENFKIKKIETDLNASRVFDTFVFEDKIYVSFSVEEKNCNKIHIDYAEINFDKLKFSNFFKSKTCNETGSIGRMQFFKFNENKKGLIFSTADGLADQPGTSAQDKNSLFGKIIFVDFKNQNYEIFSLGHRVAQGLFAKDQVVIATEHGPRGGDEINNVVYGKNYGWPIVSLGELYDFQYGSKKLKYKKDHKSNNFIEPIYSFIPSIGISELIELPKNFSIYYDNHFLVSTLNDRSLYFVRMNNNYSKILSSEKVFIGQRIRDLKYFSKKKTIILALEENSEIGFILND